MKLRLTSNEVIHLNRDETIFSALKRAGVYLTAPCSGKGTCGKCKIRVVEGDFRAISFGNLSAPERESGIVLACRTFPESDILAEIPRESLLVIGDKIAVSGTRDLAGYLKSYGTGINPMVRKVLLDLPIPTISDHISDLERLTRALAEKKLAPMDFPHSFVASAGKTLREAGWKVDLSYIESAGRREAVSLSSRISGSRMCGLAIDIGTTTVVVYLADLATGEIIDTGSTYNSQIRFGDDVITRIIHAAEGGGLSELREAVVSDVNALTGPMIERHDIGPSETLYATIASNTVMSHIFWGLDPASIREEPYIPLLNRFPLWKASAAGLSINPEAPVYTAPCVASYVGGDIVAGVLASKMHRKEELALFMDVGTNGEIAIGSSEWLMAAACSAGPCFEGSGIRCGMRATNGAVEAVRIDNAAADPSLAVVGGGSPLGICGSGMIDAISEMLLAGIIDRKGRFIEGRSSRIRPGEDGLEYVIYSDKGRKKDIVLTDVDIENIIRAKAAVYSGISTLLSSAGLSIGAIEKVYIAGGFGNYIDVGKAVLLGMLPDIPEEKFTFLGNASVTGAYLCLLSEDLRQEAEEIASKMTYMELSVSRMFMDEYVSALFLPHTNMDLFPSVASRLNKGGVTP